MLEVAVKKRKQKIRECAVKRETRGRKDKREMRNAKRRRRRRRRKGERMRWRER